MEKSNVFEKKHGEEDVLNDMSGVLDHLNLPPAFVEFVRNHQRFIQVLIGVVVVAVVFFSLYGSYREKKVDQGAQALATAIEVSGAEKITALSQVVKDYSSTSSALWAEVEIAHETMSKGEFESAAKLYAAISEKAGKKDPVYTLSMIGVGQAKEASADNAGALTVYNEISSMVGYEGIGYAGAARIHELNGDDDKALEVYEQYLGELASFPASYPEKIIVEEKIARLSAAK